MTTTAPSPLPPRAVRRCAHPLNLFHASVYFSPEYAEELAAAGVKDPHAAYFAGRAAALGAVGAGAVTGTFYNFSHALVARHLPAVWESASPADALAARLRAADRTVRRLLGDAADSTAMAEAAELALRAVEACTRHARPLYAAHADLPVPDAPHLAYWHAATLLREHRGDAHFAALLTSGLDPLESLVAHGATGAGASTGWVLASRGWVRADWDAAVERLRGRGLMDGEGALTEAGAALREEVEDLTDRMDTAPYAHLGETGVARLTELARGFLATAAEAGAFPGGLTGRR
ncbi:SCO6745 family protein [Streptomyces fradiae]|uniref:SCO6745 family protein n=1 Tax=Streptomyces fradiae TaxID=1906 RepID=UPI00368950C6